MSGEGSQGAEPVGSGKHVVRAGQDIGSIAHRHGFFWETVWQHPDNTELRRVRKNPNVLRPGDRISIPERRVEHRSAATEQKHRYRVKGVPAKIRLQVLEADTPRADTEYVFNVDGDEREGKTDGEGWIELSIPPDAQRGLIFLDGDTEPAYELDLGGLDPIDDPRGVQQRLKNLGYDCEPTGRVDDATRDALKAFRRDNDLDDEPGLDDAVKSKLEDLHGS